MNLTSIPQFNHEGLLPPFTGDPCSSIGNSPYKSNVSDLIHRFGTSKRRVSILAGYIKHRRRLFQIGIKNGFQWINGSFLQNLNREPRDIDVVTIFYTNLKRCNFNIILKKNHSLFIPTLAKKFYDTDAHFVDVAALNYYTFSRQLSFYLGLFSHARDSFLWKGILEILLPTSAKECDEEFQMITKIFEKYNV